MIRSCLLLIAIAAMLMTGCAPMDQKSAEASSDKDYVTGSRLPSRDRSSSSYVTGVENRQDIDEVVRGRGAAGPPPGTK